MTFLIRNYVAGAWQEGRGARTPLYNPTTEAVCAEASAEGIDLKKALAYARDKGGPALRELSFAARGKLLAAVAAAIHAEREALIDAAVDNGGNTRGDAKFDIDGATATLSHYAELGAKLGEARVLVDGEAVQLGRNPRWIGQHVQVPLTGVAVHVNAFNFPAWNAMEKAAVAWLAGMPVLSKPATSTALVAARIAEIIVSAKILPDGAFSFVAGGARDLVDHLTSQDVLAFTGSSDTGALFRARPNVIRESVRLNIEADSLNAAVLGPDVERGGETYEMFLRDVAREVTQKAGQKCTALRRIFVQGDRARDVAQDLAERLREVKVGDPALNEVKMGPLATAAQLKEAKAGLAELMKNAQSVLNDGGRGPLVGVDGERGYFMAPVLLRAEKGDATHAVHAREVFAPVATVVPYGVAGEALKLVQAGGGSLQASIYSDDQDFTDQAVFGLASHHGRLFFGSAKIADQAMGPGAVLAPLLHGGPGRAGGGQELGGVRGLSLYLQRTALQGSKPMLEKTLQKSGQDA